MFAAIAPNYDRVNGWVSLSLHHRWRQIAVRTLNIKLGDRVLDVCCGTGDFLVPLSEAVGKNGHVEGTDFCLPMLAVARKKLGSGVSLVLSDACDLPYCSEFDAVTVGWGIRNVPDIDRVHREIFRVLKPGGRFVSLDMAVPKNPILRKVSLWVTGKFTPWLGKRFSPNDARAYEYLPESTKLFMGREELTRSMEEAGFVRVTTRNLMFGNICIHRGEKP